VRAVSEWNISYVGAAVEGKSSPSDIGEQNGPALSLSLHLTIYLTGSKTEFKPTGAVEWI